jgi:hypothetical protein
MTWIAAGGRRFGGVSGDATGQGPYSVWNGGRVQDNGRCELELTGAREGGRLPGHPPLSRPMPIERWRAMTSASWVAVDALASLAGNCP